MPKILFLASQNVEGLSDTVFNGLNRLGCSVVEFPYKPFYHCSMKSRKIQVHAMNGEVIASEDSNGNLILKNGMNSSRKFATFSDYKYPISGLPDVEDYDIIIAGYLQNKFSLPILARARKSEHQIIFLDGSDYPFIFKTFDARDWYLKRELYKSHNMLYKKMISLKEIGIKKTSQIHNEFSISLENSLKNIMFPVILNNRIKPLNLTITDHSFEEYTGEKIFDVSLIIAPNNAYRRKFSNLFRHFATKYSLKFFLNVNARDNSFYAVNWQDYVKIVQQSRICISLPGIGFDTYRYWEIPYYGSCLVSPRLPLNIENDFIDMKSAVFFSTFSEFKNKVLKLLESGAWEEIARNGHREFSEYHNTIMRAKTVLFNT